jgi:hypothetical protein
LEEWIRECLERRSGKEIWKGGAIAIIPHPSVESPMDLSLKNSGATPVDNPVDNPVDGQSLNRTAVHAIYGKMTFEPGCPLS